MSEDSDDDQASVWTSSQVLSLYRAMIEKRRDFDFNDLDKQIEEIDGLPIWDQVLIRARWGKYIDLLFAIDDTLQRGARSRCPFRSSDKQRHKSAMTSVSRCCAQTTGSEVLETSEGDQKAMTEIEARLLS
jgi:hypothetical protein